jgi:hypothetical protein
MSLYKLTNAKIRRERARENCTKENILEILFANKKCKAGFCLSLALCSYTTQKRRRRDISRYVVIQKKKKEKYISLSQEDTRIRILYRNLKKRERENILRMRQTSLAYR